MRKLQIIGIEVLTGTLADTRPTMMDVEVDEEIITPRIGLLRRSEFLKKAEKNM